MARRLPGEPEDYMSERVAKAFRAAAGRCGVPPVMYLTAEHPGMPSRYSGDEYGMTITGGGVALHVQSGLRALCGTGPIDEGLPKEVDGRKSGPGTGSGA